MIKHVISKYFKNITKFIRTRFKSEPSLGVNKSRSIQILTNDSSWLTSNKDYTKMTIR